MKILTVVKFSGLVSLLISVAGLTFAQAIPTHQLQSAWYRDGQQHIADRISSAVTLPDSGRAKNVVLFVGDGMGIATLGAARILGGQRAGNSGEEASLSFENFAHTALVKTYNADAQIPDSAGTMTAMMSGIKTNAGVVGVNASVLMGNCRQVEGNEMATVLDLAEIKGLATGIVTTARVTHATPAAAYARSANRGWEDISDQPADVIEQGCEDIASQLVNFKKNLEQRFPNADVDGIDVVFGGGRRHFLPATSSQSLAEYGQDTGDRTDNKNLIEQWQATFTDGQYVFDKNGLEALQVDNDGPVLGLFSSSHMHYEGDKASTQDAQPRLSQMVETAIELLQSDSDGFLLIVESGRIDHAHHAGNAYNALNETLELSQAVSLAQQLTKPEDTLIMVTADHSHVMTFAGYPKRGNPILGKVVSAGSDSAALAEDGLPYTTLGYANGPGFKDYGDNTNPDRTYNDPVASGRHDLDLVNTQASGFHQEALVPLVAETHGGEDVALHATGAGAFRVQGTIEQNVVFHIIDKALGLTR